MTLAPRSTRRIAARRLAPILVAAASLAVPATAVAGPRHGPGAPKRAHRSRHAAERHGHRTTSVLRPAASTGAASSVTSSAASLAASVNPNGSSTSYRFSYGTSTSYGSSTASTAAGSGTTSVSVQAALSGLAPSTTYHYRVVATNAGGTTYGADATFTTAAGSPPPPPPPPSGGGGYPNEVSPQASWVAPGTAPLPDAQAAALVTHEPETRSGNVQANAYVPSDSQLQAFHSAVTSSGVPITQANPWYAYVTGRSGLSNPSTDDLAQWVAHKWGIPEDWVRAMAVVESYWRMSSMGDRTTVSSSWYSLYPPQAQIASTSDVYQSMGLTSVKWIPDGSVGAGTEPLRWESTAFNLDYWAATVRWYYDGDCGWCSTGYSAGQQWNSVAAWYEPYPWNNSGQQSYVQQVQTALTNRTWAQPGF